MVTSVLQFVFLQTFTLLQQVELSDLPNAALVTCIVCDAGQLNVKVEEDSWQTIMEGICPATVLVHKTAIAIATAKKKLIQNIILIKISIDLVQKWKTRYLFIFNRSIFLSRMISLFNLKKKYVN